MQTLKCDNVPFEGAVDPSLMQVVDQFSGIGEGIWTVALNLCCLIGRSC